MHAQAAAAAERPRPRSWQLSLQDYNSYNSHSFLTSRGSRRTAAAAGRPPPQRHKDTIVLHHELGGGSLLERVGGQRRKQEGLRQLRRRQQQVPRDRLLVLPHARHIVRCLHITGANRMCISRNKILMYGACAPTAGQCDGKMTGGNRMEAVKCHQLRRRCSGLQRLLRFWNAAAAVVPAQDRGRWRSQKRAYL